MQLNLLSRPLLAHVSSFLISFLSGLGKYKIALLISFMIAAVKTILLALVSLPWVSFLYCIKHKLLVFSFRALHDLYPLYWSSLIQYHEVWHPQLTIPYVSHSHTYYIFKQTSLCFLFCAKLPVNIHEVILLFAVKPLCCDIYNKLDDS